MGRLKQPLGSTTCLHAGRDIPLWPVPRGNPLNDLFCDSISLPEMQIRWISDGSYLPEAVDLGSAIMPLSYIPQSMPCSPRSFSPSVPARLHARAHFAKISYCEIDATRPFARNCVACDGVNFTDLARARWPLCRAALSPGPDRPFAKCPSAAPSHGSTRSPV